MTKLKETLRDRIEKVMKEITTNPKYSVRPSMKKTAIAGLLIGISGMLGLNLLYKSQQKNKETRKMEEQREHLGSLTNRNEIKRQNEIERYSSSWNITNNATLIRGNQDHPFNLNVFAVDGQQYYPVKGYGHVEVKTNTLDLLLYSTSETSLVIDPKNKSISPEANNFYIPTLITNEEGNLATNIKIKRKDPNTPTVNRHAWSLGSGGQELSTTNYTEEAMPYKLKTQRIGGFEFFIVRKGEFDKDSTGFYMMPATNTSRVISPNGDITLRRQEGIYEPRKISKREYSQILIEKEERAMNGESEEDADVLSAEKVN